MPFMKSGVGIKDFEDSWQRGQRSSSTNPVNVKYDTQKLNSIYGHMGENIYAKVLAEAELGFNAHVKAFQGESKLPQTEGCSNTICKDMHMRSDDKVGRIFAAINVSF